MPLVIGLVATLLAAAVSPATSPAATTAPASLGPPSAAASASTVILQYLDPLPAGSTPKDVVPLSRAGVKGLGCIVFLRQHVNVGYTCTTTVDATGTRHIKGSLLVPADAREGAADVTVVMCPRGCGELPTPPPALPPDARIRAEFYRGTLTVVTPVGTTAAPTTAAATTAAPTSAVATRTTAAGGASSTTPTSSGGVGGLRWPLSARTTAAGAGLVLLLLAAALVATLLHRLRQRGGPLPRVLVSVRPGAELAPQPDHSVRVPGITVRVRLGVGGVVPMRPVRRSS